MKFAKYAMMAAGCVLFAACSSDEPLADNNVVAPAEGTDTGFASFTVNLPTTPANRATSYETGTAQEYAVLNGKVLIFQNVAGSEADAKFVCMGDLSGMNWSAAQGGEITTSSKSVAQLTDINLTDASVTYSAAVVLNYGSDFTFPVVGETFGSWSKKAQSGKMMVADGGKDYITMTNAPAYDPSSPVTLVNIDKSKIAQSAASVTSSAATIHVQRAVAKVTLTTKDSYDVTGAGYSGDKVSISAWGLDITNKTSFPVQVTTGLSSTYSGIWSNTRFFNGNSAVFNRVFWGIDPNYSNNITTQAQIEANFNVVNNVTSKPEAVYCLENTFDINHQMQGQTTRVVMKGKYTPKNMTAGQTFFKLGANSTLFDASGLKAEIEAKAKTTLNATDVVVDLGKVGTTAGVFSLNDLSIKKGNAEVDATAKTNIAAALGLGSASDKAISTYLNGEVFYIARIKHFGDDETPWSVGNETYASNNDKWLGRYGVVRNTIYSVEINSVSNPGSPVVPEINPEEPDDVNDYYIMVNVNMLAWAKRTNSVDI